MSAVDRLAARGLAVGSRVDARWSRKVRSGVIAHVGRVLVRVRLDEPIPARRGEPDDRAIAEVYVHDHDVFDSALGHLSPLGAERERPTTCVAPFCRRETTRHDGHCARCAGEREQVERDRADEAIERTRRP